MNFYRAGDEIWQTLPFDKRKVAVFTDPSTEFAMNDFEKSLFLLANNYGAKALHCLNYLNYAETEGDYMTLIESLRPIWEEYEAEFDKINQEWRMANGYEEEV